MNIELSMREKYIMSQNKIKGWPTTFKEKKKVDKALAKGKNKRASGATW